MAPGVIPERVCQPRRDTRFVHIDNDYWQDLQTSDRGITVWNLMMMADIWSWEIHRKISLDDLWAQNDHKVLGLPAAPLMPEFPRPDRE